VTEPHHGPHHLYASPETLAQLGALAEKLPRWAGRNVVLVTRADILAGISDPGIKAHISSMPEVAGYKAEAYAIAALLGGNGNTLTEAFLKAAGRAPGIPGKEAFFGKDGLTQEGLTLAVAAVNAVTGTPTSAVLDGKKLFDAGPGGTCIIMAPALDMSAKDAAAMLTGIPSEKLQNIPGDGSTWRDFIFAHEAYHCADYSLDKFLHGPGGVLKLEVDADRGGLRSMFADSANPAEKAAFSQAVVGIRALSILPTLEGTNHDTSAFLTAPGGDEVPPPEPGELYDNGAAAAEFVRLTTERMAKDGHLPSARDALDIAAGSPELFYNAVSSLAAEGAYRGNPVAETYAGQFLAAARAYAPDYFMPVPAAEPPPPRQSLSPPGP
jgi:hypothetical protein